MKKVCSILMWFFGVMFFITLMGGYILSMLGYTEPGIGETGPNYLHRAIEWSAIFAMFAAFSAIGAMDD